jgi:hypothetical protein
MKTFDELILTAGVAVDQAVKRRDSALAAVKLIHARAQNEARSGLTEAETAEVNSQMEAHKRAEQDVAEARASLGQLKDAKTREDANDIALATRTTDSKTEAVLPSYDRVARVGSEERTYHRGSDRSGSRFVRDVINQHLFRDIESEQRLLRHMQEERVERGQYLERATNTGAFTGLVVPQYLTDMKAPAVAARRPFADICNKHELPANGMTVNISRITTATSVALQASENAAVSETNIDDTLLTENVQTAAGQQTISRQAIERGTGVEETVLDDLFRRYATTLDSTLINQATTGLSAVANAVTYTDATPTTAELWPKLHNALANSEAALLGQATPNFAVMHSRRWYWMQSQVGTSWPFFGQPGIAPQTGGTNLATTYGAGARGVLPNGLIAIVDNNIGTTLGAGTEDEIYVVASDECHLWEDPNAPVFIRAEQTAAASLGVLLVLYGYFAYSFRRYTNGQSKINGTGLIAPTF